VQGTNKRLGKEEKLVTNPKLERAKSKGVEETKAVLKFGHKIRGNWQTILTSCCSLTRTTRA